MSARLGYHVFIAGEFAGSVWGTKAHAMRFFAETLRDEKVREPLLLKRIRL